MCMVTGSCPALVIVGDRHIYLVLQSSAAAREPYNIPQKVFFTTHSLIIVIDTFSEGAELNGSTGKQDMA